MTRTLETAPRQTICVNCGVPVDSQHFDESGFSPAPAPGARVILARFVLPPQYCGVLEFFSQFTDAFARDASQVETPSLEWLLLVNGRALYPYVNFPRILNPWGFGSYPVNLRLEEGSTLEFGVQGKASAAGAQAPQRAGGRILGRYWYNPAYGDPVRRRF